MAVDEAWYVAVWYKGKLYIFLRVPFGLRLGQIFAYISESPHGQKDQTPSESPMRQPVQKLEGALKV